jgi:hypothetical protein
MYIKVSNTSANYYDNIQITVNMEYRRDTNGKLHCVDGPAVVDPKGGTTERLWYQHDKLHRTDGPAREWPKEGIKEWYFEGKKVEPMFHECKVDEDGTKKYYNEKGELHRTYGPAVEYTDWRYSVVFEWRTSS